MVRLKVISEPKFSRNMEFDSSLRFHYFVSFYDNDSSPHNCFNYVKTSRYTVLDRESRPRWADKMTKRAKVVCGVHEGVYISNTFLCFKG